jgi:hypothetical protein
MEVVVGGNRDLVAGQKSGVSSLRVARGSTNLPRMKKLRSLRALALAGVAITLMATGCSSTSSNRADTGSTDSDDLAAYRMSSAFGSVPITDVRYLGKFPMEWGPVAYESYTFRVPVADQSTADTTAVGSAPEFQTNLQPGDTFVEAAGADGSPRVKKVIRYTPFGGGGAAGTGAPAH